MQGPQGVGFTCLRRWGRRATRRVHKVRMESGWGVGQTSFTGSAPEGRSDGNTAAEQSQQESACRNLVRTVTSRCRRKAITRERKVV